MASTTSSCSIVVVAVVVRASNNMKVEFKNGMLLLHVRKCVLDDFKLPNDVASSFV